MPRPDLRMGTMHIVDGETVVVVYSNPIGLTSYWACKSWVYLGKIYGNSYLWTVNCIYGSCESFARENQGDIVNEVLDVSGTS
jgi:hypothetical protein